MSLHPGIQTILSTNPFNNSPHNIENFDEVINLVVIMSLAAAFAVGVAFFALFTSTAKVLPNIFHGYVLVTAIILSSYTTMYSTHRDKIPLEARVVAAVTASTLLLSTYYLGSFWNFIRFRNTRKIRINEKTSYILGVIFPIAHLALVVLFFLDKRNLEGGILCLYLSISILLAKHVLTNYDGAEYELRMDLLDRLEYGIAIKPASKEELKGAQNYQTDEKGFTHPFREFIH